MERGVDINFRPYDKEGKFAQHRAVFFLCDYKIHTTLGEKPSHTFGWEVGLYGHNGRAGFDYGKDGGYHFHAVVHHHAYAGGYERGEA